MAGTAVPATVPPPPSLASASPRGFAAFDDRVLAGHPGLVVIRAPEDAHDSLLAHAARRLRTSGFDPVVVTGASSRALVRELALQLGVTVVADAAAMAESLGTTAEDLRVALLLQLPDAGAWDGSVLAELARTQKVLLVGIASHPSKVWCDEANDVFELGPFVRGAERLRWLGAIAEEAQQELTHEALADLESWWRGARREPETREASLTELSREVLLALGTVGRSVDASLLPPAAIAELALAGLVRVRADRALATRPAAASPLTPAQRALAVRLLESDHTDPWDAMRSAELLLQGSPELEDAERADAASQRAFERALDPRVADELAERWFSAVEPLGGEVGLLLRRRAAERALASGDAHGARRWCESASALVENDPETELLRGRALVLAGDLVAARVALQRIARTATEAELSARVAVELATLALAGGRHDEAIREARRAEEEARTSRTKLDARNVQGKVLLAQARWDDADAHFAEDAMLATSAGDRVARMRSGVNRAIAVLSKGRLDDARAMLERVLEQALREGEDLAAAFALSNLALIALRKEEYGRALSCWEEAVQRGQALRGRVGAAQTLANLAELRLRLGLLEHAEQSVAFGRRLLAGGGPTAVSAQYRLVAAKIAMERKRLEVARAEIEAALGDALAASHSGILLQVWFVAARVALEEGDLARLREALERADALSSTERAKAELVLLRSKEARARGEDVRETAEAAVTSSLATRDKHLSAEAHAFAALVHREAGDEPAATVHVVCAKNLVSHVATSLPEDLRDTFLARSEITSFLREAGLEVTPRIVRIGASAPESIAIVAQAEQRRIVGQDPHIKSLLQAIRKVARSSSTVLVRGESGTGKELVAEEIHRQSPRAGGPLVSVNCAALVETLLLSELFGHEKGAFTGASARRRGRFEMAEGGTLFLDEIGDISPKTQVALLRVLQEKTFERVGGTTPIKADVRVICATHRDLRKMVERGEFREDLYYRLNEITLDVPALRNRLGDLAEIASHLLGRIARERGEAPKGLAQTAVQLLARHAWPGNVRELENVLRATSLFAEADVITDADLVENVEDLRALAAAEPPCSGRVTMRPPPAESTEDVVAGSDDDDALAALPPLGEETATATAVAYAQVRRGNVGLSDLKRQIERDCIVRALAETKGNITRAAALLGMKRPRLSQLAKAYGITGSSEGT